MKRLVLISIVLHICLGMIFLYGPTYEVGAGSKGVIRNGDVNASGKVDLGDAVYILTYLFSNGAEPVDWTCPEDLLASQAALVSCQAERDSLQAQLSACREELAQSETLCEFAMSTCAADKAALHTQLVECQAKLIVHEQALAEAEAEKDSLENELLASQSDLAECQGELLACRGELAQGQAELLACRSDLVACQADLLASQSDLAECQGALRVCQSDLEGCHSRMGLAATGQTMCFNAAGAEIDCNSTMWPGQDGYYQKSCPMAGRFVDNGDGTVTDSCTGLMWQEATANIPDDDDDRVTWTEALRYCENLEFAGHDDWRLPNVRELQSIVDYGRYQPSIDPVFSSEPSFYWSSTSHAEAPDIAWEVQFQYGFVYFSYKSVLNNCVRAVRGG